jgi:hypothetical protein
VPTLAQNVLAALSRWWTLAEAEAYAGTSATDTIAIAQATAANAGESVAFSEYSAIAALYGFAARMSNAAGALQAAPDTAPIDATMIGVPPWGRPDQEMATTPVWHAIYNFSYIDQAGQMQTDHRTSVFEMTLPDTVGELSDSVIADAQDLADKYSVQFVSADLQELHAV